MSDSDVVAAVQRSTIAILKALAVVVERVGNEGLDETGNREVRDILASYKLDNIRPKP